MYKNAYTINTPIINHVVDLETLREGFSLTKVPAQLEVKAKKVITTISHKQKQVPQLLNQQTVHDSR